MLAAKEGVEWTCLRREDRKRQQMMGGGASWWKGWTDGKIYRQKPDVKMCLCLRTCFHPRPLFNRWGWQIKGNLIFVWLYNTQQTRPSFFVIDRRFSTKVLQAALQLMDLWRVQVWRKMPRNWGKTWGVFVLTEASLTLFSSVWLVTHSRDVQCVSLCVSC